MESKKRKREKGKKEEMKTTENRKIRENVGGSRVIKRKEGSITTLKRKIKRESGKEESRLRRRRLDNKEMGKQGRRRGKRMKERKAV